MTDTPDKDKLAEFKREIALHPDDDRYDDVLKQITARLGYGWRAYDEAVKALDIQDRRPL